jgi:diguanylate cyclase (GGDEF)-like protein
MLVQLHENTRRIGALESEDAILGEAADSLGRLVAAVGVGYYRLAPEGLLLSGSGGNPQPAFPSALIVTSSLGGVLAGSPQEHDPTSMPLGESKDGASGALVELLRAGPEGRVTGVLWIRRPAEALDAPTRSTVSVLVDHVGIALRNAQLLAEERRRAAIDDLTGLFRRAHFLREAHREISRARRNGKPLSALMIDADHFKRVNDEHGHAGGDAVLQALAAMLIDATRETDVVGRLGGEEFAVLLPDADLEGALIAAERLRAAVQETPVPVATGTLHVTVSVGIAQWSSAEDTDALLRRADGAMYTAKDLGRNCVVVAEASSEI